MKITVWYKINGNETSTEVQFPNNIIMEPSSIELVTNHIHKGNVDAVLEFLGDNEPPEDDVGGLGFQPGFTPN